MPRKIAAQQLSIPGLEPGRDEDGQEITLPEARTRPSPTGVASGRSLTHPVQIEHVTAALLTTGEAARLLRVHPRTVQRLVERGELSAVHFGSAVRFDPVDVADLTARLKRRETTTSAPIADAVRRDQRSRVSFGERLRSRTA
jgi:excisionase family DNA binding protein